MAQCLQRSLRAPASLQAVASAQWIGRRSFAAASPLCQRLPRPQQPRPALQSSLRVISKQRGGGSSDLGLLPMTFITPTGPNAPSLFRAPRQLAKLQWIRVKRKASDLFSIAIYRWSHRAHLKIKFRQTGPTAVGLHRQMYAAFAEGDLATLRNICADGLLETLSARIASRPKSETVKWELIKYTKRERVVSNRAAALMMDNAGLRQAVVRINSRQRLTRFNADGSVVPGTGVTRDVQEYIVIQKRLLHGKEDDWVVWGTTEETTLDAIEKPQEV